MNAVGSVFLDNTTLEQAALRRPLPDAVAASSLALMVEAVAVHERIYVLGGIDNCRSAVPQMSQLAPGVVVEIAPEEAVPSEAIGDLSDQVVKILWQQPQHISLGRKVEKSFVDYDPFLPDIPRRWEQLSSSARLLSDPMSTHGEFHYEDCWPTSGDRFQRGVIGRTILYYLAARSFGIPYSPHMTRTEILLQITRMMGKEQPNPTAKVVGVIEEIRQHYAGMIRDAMGVPVVRLEMPLFLSIAMEGANSVQDVIHNAFHIRKLEEVVALRNWISSMVRDMAEGNVSQVVISLQELQSAKETLMQKLKPEGLLPVSIGWPHSISVDALGLRDSLVGREPLCLMRDILDLSMQGTQERSILAGLIKKIRRLAKLDED